MVAASSLVLTVYLEVVALSNFFVGGSSLMVRLMGEKREEDARKVAAYSIAASVLAALAFALLTLAFLGPLLRLLGASDNTFLYATSLPPP